MYIAPNTNLHILKNVPLDTSYEHSIYFSNASAQYTYFNSLAKYRYAQYSYVRPNTNQIKVGQLADNLYDCNYIMFQNQAFGNKWFYAYITSVEYVNNETSLITFDLDVIQTWYFQFEVDYCMVERTHTVTDVVGEHIEPENVSTGDYILNSYEEIIDLSTLDVIVGICDVEEGAAGLIFNGVYSGAELWQFKNTADAAINAIINRYAQRPEAVTVMYMCPRTLIGSAPPNDGGIVPTSNEGKSIEFTPTNGNVQNAQYIDGYLVKNKKLFTYPYCFYHVNDGNGNGLSLRYEFFTGGQVKFQLYGTVLQPVQVTISPKNYKAWSGASGMVNRNECLTISSFPMCSWNMDSYKAWVAQNSIPIAVQSGLQYAGAIGQALTLDVGGAIQSAAHTTANLFVQDYKASIAADISRGNATSGNVTSTVGQNTFFGGMCTISAEYARCIDDYFSLYGYAVRRLMKPIYNARPHWTYIKTVDATITGSLPADDMKRIIEIFNTGITFWMNGAEVGHYELDNRPVSGG